MDTPMQIPPGHVAKAVVWERWSVDGVGGHVPPAPLCPVTACAWGWGGRSSDVAGGGRHGGAGTQRSQGEERVWREATLSGRWPACPSVLPSG